MGAAQVVAQLHGADLGQHVRNAQNIAQRLGHLLTGHGDPAVVHPVARKRVTRSVGLCNFVFVVRELQVQAAAVNIKLRAQVLCGHSRALNVPAGATIAPRCWPAWFPRLCCFPHCEVARVAFAGASGFTLIKLVEFLAGKMTVVRQGGWLHVHVAVSRITVTIVDDAAHVLHHLCDVPCGAWLD